jgi:hypothetical protein
MREPLADAVRDRSLQRVMMKNVLVDEGRELRLAPRDISASLRIRPDRIDLIEARAGRV